MSLKSRATILHHKVIYFVPLISNMFLIQEGGRLLYIGQNEWTHINCALWSSEVFEDDEGSLKNVHMAVLRGKQLVRHVARHHWSLSSFRYYLPDPRLQPVVALLSALREVPVARGHSQLLSHIVHQ